MSINTYIRLGLGTAMVCMCLQVALFCLDKGVVVKTGEGHSIRAIQTELEASEINDAA